MTTWGLLNLDKPSGVTSRHVVDRVQRLAGRRKAGHAGTLDPLASGVLVVAVGAATRLVEYVQRMPKRYLGTFLLGRQSPTEDVEGEVVRLADPPVPTEEAICRAAQTLTGQILQRPPAYSALKVRGHRAYDLARQGKPVVLEPRKITVYRLDVVAYDYPELKLAVECSGGTYVRSLGRDLAEALGTGAVMSALVRTAIGEFTLERAVPLAELTADNWSSYLRPALEAVEQLPQVTLDPQQLRRIRAGQTIARPGVEPGRSDVAALDERGRLVALLRQRGDDQLGPRRNFPPEE